MVVKFSAPIDAHAFSPQFVWISTVMTAGLESLYLMVTFRDVVGCSIDTSLTVATSAKIAPPPIKHAIVINFFMMFSF
jgi:hypothetical protein